MTKPETRVINVQMPTIEELKALCDDYITEKVGTLTRSKRAELCLQVEILVAEIQANHETLASILLHLQMITKIGMLM